MHRHLHSLANVIVRMVSGRGIACERVHIAGHGTEGARGNELLLGLSNSSYPQPPSLM